MTADQLPPEPPDGTRMEFEFHTDVYAMWRDDNSSIQAGWPAGDGGHTWVLYGDSVPRTWSQMAKDFSADPHPFLTAVRLLPHPDDLPNRRSWPTQRRHGRPTPWTPTIPTVALVADGRATADRNHPLSSCGPLVMGLTEGQNCPACGVPAGTEPSAQTLAEIRKLWPTYPQGFWRT